MGDRHRIITLAEIADSRLRIRIDRDGYRIRAGVFDNDVDASLAVVAKINATTNPSLDTG